MVEAIKERRGYGRWLLVWASVLTWGLAPAQAQPDKARAVGRDTTKGKPELVMEMRFDQTGRPQVTQNEIARLRSQGKMTEFPIKAMVRQKEKKIIWFDENGGVKDERVFEDAKGLWISDDGEYYIVAKGDGHFESPQEFEYKNKNGQTLWKREGRGAIISPTGETVIMGNRFITQSGEIYELEEGKLSTDLPKFTQDGKNILVLISTSKNNHIAFLDKTGRTVWTALENANADLVNTKTVIAGSGNYLAVGQLKITPSPKVHKVILLDRKGRSLWEVTTDRPQTIVFSPDEKKIAVLEYKKRAYKVHL